MKNILFVSAVFSSAFILTACTVLTQVSDVRSSSVGAGIKLIGTDGLLSGQPATADDVSLFKRKGVVYHDGHSYTIQQGVYVLMR